MDTKRVFIGLGGNLGDPAAQLCAAIDELTKTDGVEVQALSRLYKTSPVSPYAQPDYLNAACLIHCTLEPMPLLHALQRIEATVQGTVKAKDAPRYLDIDILLFDEIVLDHPLLTIPHPRWQQRLFVVAPLADLDPSFIPLRDALKRESRDRVEPINSINWYRLVHERQGKDQSHTHIVERRAVGASS